MQNGPETVTGIGTGHLSPGSDPTLAALGSFTEAAQNARGPATKPKDELLARCIALIKEGKIEEFNAHRPAGKLDFKRIDLTGLNLTGVDLRYVDLSRAVLHKANLTGAMLQHSVLDRADLSETVLEDAKFHKASLVYADLTAVRRANKADFQDANLRGSELSRGDFSGAYFSRSSLITAFLVDAKFINAHMEEVRLAGASLSRANFQGANLHKARFFQANGQDIIFDDSNLTGAEAVQSSFTSSNKDLGGGKKTGTSFDGAWVKGFSHNGAIPEEMMLGSLQEQAPPEGYFPVTPKPNDQRLLVHEIPGSDRVLYDAALEELSELIGLKEVKESVQELLEHLQASAAREKIGLPRLDYTLHQVYTGNPGTGKTTVARIYSRLLHSLGALGKGHLVETSKTGLIAGYAGQTLGKTKETIDSSLGGTLLIDEAYALTQSKEDAYAQDAISELTKRLEDDRDKFACIVAGYTKEMKKFIDANSGLKSRFTEFVEFPDYSTGELVDIMKLMMDKKVLRYDQKFLANASMLLCAKKEIEGRQFGNGREVRQSVEKMTRLMSRRLTRESKLGDRHALTHPDVCDLPFYQKLRISLDQMPNISELRWKGADGKELSFEQLSLDGEFPRMTDDSVNKIRGHLERANVLKPKVEVESDAE